MIRDDFLSHRYLYAIDPGYGFRNGTGVAIFDHETLRLIACGILRPFAPGLEDHRATIEMATQTKDFWIKRVGFSYDPLLLCIEYPQNCYIKNGFLVNPRNIIMLGILCSRIEGKFSAKDNLRPSPNLWKGSSSKVSTEEMVMEKLCVWSKKTLAEELSTIPKHLHHNIYDAIGLGLWAIENSKNQQKDKK